ncbi:M23 family metallopeptidase [Microbacterium sp. LWH10-1.2]|uniref:M23 family metallopeptidase n=1 Tax=Microbacterium sp. LWH10-1.2 TaxID=3135255 RepID=UPI003139F854
MHALYPESASAAGQVLWPNGTTTRPAISSPFGPRTAPTDGASTYHLGCDFVGYSSVKSIADGRVTVVGTPPGWGPGGLQVWVQHDGFLTRSLHLASTSVSVGQQVGPGTPLGIMGKSGNVTGVHHHLEVVVGGAQIDPVPFITNRINNTPIPSPVLEDNMIRISSPSRGTALLGPGYFRQLNTQEEIDNSAPLASAIIAGNDRQFDLWRSMALHGEHV